MFTRTAWPSPRHSKRGISERPPAIREDAAHRHSLTATETELRTGRSLVEPELFNDIADFTVMHFGQDRDKAERATDQALRSVEIPDHWDH